MSRTRPKRFVADLLKKTAIVSAKAGSDSEPKQRPLSKNTIRNVIAALRSLLEEAVEGGENDRPLIQANPAAKLGKYYKEAPDYREEIEPYSAEEVSLLLQTAREHFRFNDYVMLLTQFHTGNRPGETAALYWTDLDERNSTVLIRRQYTRGHKGKVKTSKKHNVKLSGFLLAEVKTLKRQRQEEYLARGKNEIPELIFLSAGKQIWKDGKLVGHEEGKIVDMDNWVKRVFFKMCDKAQVRRHRFYDTRHTCASILLNNGENLKLVQAQLGHSSIRVTADTYGHLEIASDRGAMNRLPTTANSAPQLEQVEAASAAIRGK